MNAMLIEYHNFEPNSPSFLSFSPTVKQSALSSAPGYDLQHERNARRGLDVMMELSEDSSINPSITPGTLARFYAALPRELPDVEPYVSAQGSVCFDWDEDPQHTISLMIQSDTRLAFAAYLAGNRVHGVTIFQGQVLDAELHALIRQWHQSARECVL